MDQARADSPKLPDMIMCGDHPSFTKTELNLKESSKDEKQRPSVPPSLPRLHTSQVSGTERVLPDASPRRPPTAERAAAQGNNALVQAALGSFRWPPYLLVVWVVVLVVTHALYCVVSMLEKMLPSLKRACEYTLRRTEEAWRAAGCTRQLWACGALAATTGSLHALYAAACAVRAAAAWLLEPLCAGADELPLATLDLDQTQTRRYDALN